MPPMAGSGRLLAIVLDGSGHPDGRATAAPLPTFMVAIRRAAEPPASSGHLPGVPYDATPRKKLAPQ